MSARQLLLVIAFVGLLAVPSLAAASSVSYPPLKASVSGPTLVAVSATEHYVVNATGGPSSPSGGSGFGNYSYNASIVGGNTSGSSVTPATGSLKNDTTTLTLVAPNNTGTYTLTVEVKSQATTGNASYTNATITFTVVQPYVVSTTIDNPTPYKIRGAVVEVALDGAVVNDITLPTIGGNGSFSFTYNYSTTGLSSGYHTFTLTLKSTPGLLVFSNGQQQYTATFYVSPPAPDYTLYIVTAVSLASVAIFISLLVVGGRARRRSK